MSNVVPLDRAAPAPPPHNYAAEQALLGALLANNAAYDACSEMLSAECFAAPAHGAIYAAIESLIVAGKRADAVTLRAHFAASGTLAEIGGAQYLADLLGAMVSAIDVAEYAGLIRDLHLRRETIRIADETRTRAHQVEVDGGAEAVIEEAEARLYALADRRSARRDEALAAHLEAALVQIDAAHRGDGRGRGLETGIVDLDRSLGGLRGGDLAVLAGRPSMGKTGLALTVASNVAGARTPVGLFSLEMSADQIATRIIAHESRRTVHALRAGLVPQAAFPEIVAYAGALRPLPLYIDDSASLRISTLRTRARRLKRRFGVGLLVVDYLQLLRPSTERFNNRVAEIGEISRGLKAIAKDLDVPVLALSQLSRAVEARENKRPLLSDLRESGDIEQDADVVMFIFRESYYLEREEPAYRTGETQDRFAQRTADWQARLAQTRGIAEVIVAKHRHGPVGSVRLHFAPEQAWFSDLHRSA